MANDVERDFYVWPRKEPYGPNPKQKELFYESLDPKPHQHGTDVVLYSGGWGSGKTCAASARVIQQATDYPHLRGVVGAITLKTLRRTVQEEWEARFTTNRKWDYPGMVTHKPNPQDNFLELWNRSKIEFVHLSDWKVIRGINADIVHIEEASLIPSEDILDEMIGRVRLSNGAIRQIILTTNPEQIHGWLYDRFELNRFDPDFEGGPPPKVGESYLVGKPCDCQLCQDCINAEPIRGEFECVDGVCPNCGFIKKTTCPGRQKYHRLILTSTWDNKDHTPPEFMGNIRTGTTGNTYAMFARGEHMELRSGKCYKNFFRQVNLRKGPIDIDGNLDVVWTHDFNINPSCSVLLQKITDADGNTQVVALDEIVEWDADAVDVAKKFVEKYKGKLKKEIHIYGDPTAYTGQTSRKRTRYHQIFLILTAAGFKPVLKVPTMKGTKKIPIVERIDSVNEALRGNDGSVRLQVHERCKHLVRSLQELPWDRSGKQEEDKHYDVNANNSKDKSKIHLMSHPACALGYYIYVAMPIIKTFTAPRVAVIPEFGSLHGQDGMEILESNYVSDDDTPGDDQDFYKQESLKDILGGCGVFFGKRDFE